MHSRSLIVLFTLAGSLLLGGCSGDAKDTHPDQPVTKRKAIFKQFTKTLEPIGMVARGRKGYKADEFNASVLELQRLSSRPWGLFTADSNYPPTLAKAAVWAKPGEFKQAQDRFQAAVAGLVLASQGSDLNSIKAAVEDVQANCKRCHDQFRNDR